GGNIFIVNAGIDGQSSYGHIKAIKYWLSKYDKLKPEYFLFYLGVNDVWKDTVDNYNYDVFINNQNSKSKEKKSLYNKSALFKLKYFLDASFDYRVKLVLNHGAISNIGKWTKEGKLMKNINVLLSRHLFHYKKRLEMLNKLVVENGSKAIFVTNTSSLFQKDINGGFIGRDLLMKFNGEVINGVDYGYIYDAFNNICKEFCIENQIIFFDLASEVEFDFENDYYDSVHNTPSGCEKIGNYL
ncbi:uncharacterized protein METZ01_LOCUS482016, partial [marine metagenome]